MKRTGKKLMVFVLSAILLINCLPQLTLRARAAAISGECGDNLYWSFDESTGTLTITGSGEMNDYDAQSGLHAPWRSYVEQIKKVNLPSGLTSIGKWAFNACSRLETLVIPDGVTKIGFSAFENCTSMTSITIPDSVTSIDSGAFVQCYSLKSVTIPEGVTTIRYQLFYSCRNLSEVSLPDSLKAIENEAFWGCNSLTNVEISNGVTTVGENAFTNCSNLKSITLPESLSSIEYSTFSGCSNLTSITIPASVTTIGSSAFRGCESLTIVSIPDQVAFLGGNAFYGCTNLETVSIGHSVESIGIGAFANNQKLTNVIIPQNVKNVYAQAFYQCENLEKVAIQNPDCTIAPEQYTNINTFGIPGKTTIYGYKGSTAETHAKEYGYAFSDISALKSYTISYNANSGTEAPDTQEKLEGMSQLLRESAPQKTYDVTYNANGGRVSPASKTIDCTFKNWNTAQNGNGTAYNPGARYTENANVTLYAQWINPTAGTLPTPERENYSFDGWFTAVDGGSQVTSSTIIIGNLTVYAHWSLDNQECDHDYHAKTTSPTCTEQGFTTYTCSKCGDSYTADITPALDHDYKATIARPTCTEKGYTTYTCSRCSDSYTGDRVDALGHDWDNGQILTEPTTSTTGVKQFTCRRCGETRTETIAKLDPKVYFIDVPSTAFYAEPVTWAVENGITKGTSSTTFSPNDTCTRGQVVTFLWRAAGSSAPGITYNPFRDVTAGKYYYDAVLWAVENDITAGTSPTAFSPDAGCTRGQVVTFLWRAAGKPEPKNKDNPFTDVRNGAFYYDAVLWAVENGITNGMSATTFAPDRTCTRGQIVTFLYRSMKDKSSIVDSFYLDSLNANESYFVANQNTDIVFTVNVVGSSNEAVFLNNENGRIASMHDDGIEGDNLAKDGVYSCLLSTSLLAGETEYYASSGKSKSNTITLYAFEQPTENSMQNNEDIRIELLNIEEEFKNDEGVIPISEVSNVLYAIENYAKELCIDGKILFYEMSDHGIVMKLSSGLSICYEPVIDGLDSVGADVSMTVLTLQPCLSMYNGLDRLMLLPDEGASEIANDFSNYSFLSENNFDNAEVTLDKIKSLSSNEIILWHGHGGYSDSYHSCLMTGEDFDLNAWLWNVKYWWDCVQDRIIECSNGRVAITAKYIEKYCNNLDNSFIYLAACQSGKDSVLSDTFLNKGAAAVIANTETIYTEYNLLMEHEVAHLLTEINPGTQDYYTLSEALAEAKNIHGENDIAWYTGNNPKNEVATPVIFGGVDANDYQLASSIPQEDTITWNGHTYKVFNNSLTWTEAKEYCESLGGHLVSITSAEEQTVIESLISTGQKNQYWLGATDEAQEGTWRWITGEPWSYTNWDNNQPDDWKGAEDYLEIYNISNGTMNPQKWNDVAVDNAISNQPDFFYTDNIGFICEWDSESNELGFFNGNTYKVFNNSLTWTEAKEYCESLGGHLATITSAEEQAVIESLISTGQKKQYWLGGTDEAEEGTWRWITGETWAYTNWDAREPDNGNPNKNEDYAQIYRLPNPNRGGSREYKWNDICVDNSFPGEAYFFSLEHVGFICEWDYVT